MLRSFNYSNVETHACSSTEVRRREFTTVRHLSNRMVTIYKSTPVLILISILYINSVQSSVKGYIKKGNTSGMPFVAFKNRFMRPHYNSTAVCACLLPNLR